MALHGVKWEHFQETKDAIDAADRLVELQKIAMPQLFEENPDQIVEGWPMLDQFYYCKHEGLGACIMGDKNEAYTCLIMNLVMSPM